LEVRTSKTTKHEGEWAGGGTRHGEWRDGSVVPVAGVRGERGT